MARYTLKGDQWIDRSTGEPVSLPNRFDYNAPARVHLAGDYSGYTCPVSGAWIEGRAAHKENLKRTGCRLLEKGEREHNERSCAQESDRHTEALTERVLKEVYEQL